MPQSDHLRRSAGARVEVLRGFDPNEPTTLTQNAPVADSVDIRSGQVIYLSWNSSNLEYEWKLGCTAGNTPYIALQDFVNGGGGLTGLDQDEDVAEAGNLTGLSCSGKYEIQTAHFKSGETYNANTPLTYDGVTGDVKPTTWGSGDPVLGVLSRVRGPKSLAGENSNIVLDAGGNDVVIFTTLYDENNYSA